MGLFDRVRTLVGDGDHGDRARPPNDPDQRWGRPQADQYPNERPAATETHGTHWNAVLPGTDAVRPLVRGTVEAADPEQGRTLEDGPVTAYTHGEGPVRTRVLAVDGRVRTTYPVGEGIAHDVTLRDVDPWDSGIEARRWVDLVGARLAAFDAGYWRAERPPDIGSATLTLSAFAYKLEDAAGETVVDEAGNEYDVSKVAGLFPFDGGGPDDYVFQTVVEDVATVPFGDETLYRVRAPLFRDDDRRDVDVSLYAATHVTDGYVPSPGDDASGVLWLQGDAGAV